MSDPKTAPLTPARLEELAIREASEHTTACAVGVIEDYPCWCGGLVPVTREERDALVAVVRGLLALGPEIAEEIEQLEAEEAVWSLSKDGWRRLALLRQVRALIEGGA